MIALHVLSVALNIYVLAVISCGTDDQLQSAMIINTVPQVQKNLIDHFTVVCSVTWPLDDSEAGVDLVLIQTSLLLSCKCT